ncbi:expressed unknown protein [Seminavis robusta]|uniref:Uncharacterized protein n=1 Tax=Seminavis robusta TaxID=568900 RepID=A0A9N8H3D3_9STRA|nr:expressed unknown protein [Seminavis robusta]|eukprot:Sro57_g033400.1 n/a (115) ;mRNA; r:84943-85287
MATTTSNAAFDDGLAMVEETLICLELDGEDEKVNQHLEAIYTKLKPFQERQAAKKKAQKAAIGQATESSLSKIPARSFPLSGWATMPLWEPSTNNSINSTRHSVTVYLSPIVHC